MKTLSAEERERGPTRASTSNQVGRLAQDQGAGRLFRPQRFNLLYKTIPAVLDAGAPLPADNSLSTGTLVLELKALMVTEHRK